MIISGHLAATLRMAFQQRTIRRFMAIIWCRRASHAGLKAAMIKLTRVASFYSAYYRRLVAEVN